MGIMGDEVAGTDFQIGEVTAPTTGHEDLFAGLVGMVDYHDPATAFACLDGAHESCRAGTEDEYVCGNGFW
jgi:hypothetical protein